MPRIRGIKDVFLRQWAMASEDHDKKHADVRHERLEKIVRCFSCMERNLDLVEEVTEKRLSAIVRRELEAECRPIS